MTIIAEAGQHDMYESVSHTGCGVRAVSHLGSYVNQLPANALLAHLPLPVRQQCSPSKLAEAWAVTGIGLHSCVMERAGRAPGLGLQLVLGMPGRRGQAEPCETR